jgi:hypothetical protein
MAQALRHAGGDETLALEAAYSQIGVQLANAARAVQIADERGEYDQTTLDQLAAACRTLATVGVAQPHLYDAFRDSIAGTEAEEYLNPAVRQAMADQANADLDIAVAREQDRLDQRQKLLEREYRQIERHTGADGVQAADELARSIGDLTYHEALSDDHVRAALRSTAEQASANQRGLRKMPFLQAFDDEVMRKYGPGAVTDLPPDRLARGARAADRRGRPAGPAVAVPG